MYIRYNADTKVVVYIGDKKPLNADTELLKVVKYNGEIPKNDWLTYENGELISHFISDEVKAKQEKIKRIAELKGLLSETDYQAIKFAEGWLTAEEYDEIRTLRQSYRDEINSLEGSIKGE